MPIEFPSEYFLEPFSFEYREFHYLWHSFISLSGGKKIPKTSFVLLFLPRTSLRSIEKLPGKVSDSRQRLLISGFVSKQLKKLQELLGNLKTIREELGCKTYIKN